MCNSKTMLTPKLTYGMLTSHKDEFSILRIYLYTEFMHSSVYIIVYRTKLAFYESRHVTVNIF